MPFKGLRLRVGCLLCWFKGFVRDNPAALPILGLQGLLVVCAVLLSLSMGKVADKFAVVAYFLLAVGFAAQLFVYLRECWHGRKVSG
ncbi:MAG: hypothetical protein QXM86_00785 [Candidatus Bathyarchaeia archaeon]